MVVKEAYAACFKTPTQKQKDHAKTVMQDCSASATSVFIAAMYLLGPTFITYEPETIWLELDPCHSNRDKLMAAIALAMTPSFYWDYRVFAGTVHALNNESVVPEAVSTCGAEQMAWAAFEAELLYALTDGESSRPEYDPSVEAYVATCLFDEGYVVPPTGLGFAATELKSHLKENAPLLEKETSTAWAALPKEKLEQKKFEDSALGAQLEKLAAAWTYVAEKTHKLQAELSEI